MGNFRINDVTGPQLMKLWAAANREADTHLQQGDPYADGAELPTQDAVQFRPQIHCDTIEAPRVEITTIERGAGNRITRLSTSEDEAYTVRDPQALETLTGVPSETFITQVRGTMGGQDVNLTLGQTLGFASHYAVVFEPDKDGMKAEITEMTRVTPHTHPGALEFVRDVQRNVRIAPDGTIVEDKTSRPWWAHNTVKAG